MWICEPILFIQKSLKNKIKNKPNSCTLCFNLIACARLHYIRRNYRFVKYLKIKKIKCRYSYTHCNQRKIGNVILNQLLRNTHTDTHTVCWNGNILSINFEILWRNESIHCFGIYLKNMRLLAFLSFCCSVYCAFFSAVVDFIAAVARKRIQALYLMCNWNVRIRLVHFESPRQFHIVPHRWQTDGERFFSHGKG